MTPSTTKSSARRRFALAVLFWLALWQLVSMTLGQDILLPSPLAAGRALLGLLGQGGFWRTVVFSLSRIAGGFFLALLLSALLACLAHGFEPLRVLLSPPVRLMHATPVASFIILVLLWMDSANAAFPVAFLMVFPVLYSGLLAGLEAADPQLLEMARAFSLPLWKKGLYIYLPAALPFFLSACRAGLGLCWKSGVAAEVISQSTATIGGSLYLAKLYLQTPELFAWTAVVIALSALFERLCLTLLTRLGRRIEGGAGL